MGTVIIRNLATVKRIDDIIEHTNADNLEIAIIRGWRVVVQKELHNKNDLVCYLEIDSFLPVEERFEWLRKSSFRQMANGTEGFRIKTIKLRGEISQGVLIPLSDLNLDLMVEEDMDLTELLGVKKWEPPPPKSPGAFVGRAAANFPSFIPKTDQERIQNLRHRQRAYYDDEKFERTTKLDGSSMTVYRKDDHYAVCSRNFELKEDSDGVFLEVAAKLKLKELLEAFPVNIALQGELVGPGVNGNRSKLTEHDFIIFDIYDIDNQKYFLPYQRMEVLTKLNSLGITLLHHVPVHEPISAIPSTEEALAYAESLKYNNLPAEGVVYKAYNSGFSFKCISNKYLLKHDE